MAQNINSTMNGTNSRFVTGAGDESWEARESQRQRELEEARARAAQMEKTMKWWSECTTSWRSKWSQVRNERNKAREESKQLRASLEQSLKESNSYKREKNELEQQIQQLKKEMEKIHNCLMSHAGQFDKTGLEVDEPEREINCSPDILSDGLKNVNSEDGLVTKARTFSEEKEINIDSKDLEIEEYVLQGIHAVPKTSSEEKDNVEDKLNQQLHKTSLVLGPEDEIYAQKVKILQSRLEDAQKIINSERGEKILLQKTLEKLRQEIEDYRNKCEEMRSAKQEAVRELLTMEQTHRAELRITSNSLQDEINARESVERRMSELRAELERLQSENANEWERRERLETEKINFERENKKLRTELQDLVQNERFDRRGQRPNSGDLEVRQLQQELLERNKEITELRHSQSKMKKMLSEANTEINHAVRRAEQYEAEVKRLRSRIEELKKQLTNAEDELDSACNHLRRIQRTNDELSGHSEGLETQIVNLNSRHSSPKHQNFYQHHHKSGSKMNNYDYKPSINELKQLFDDSKRLNNDQKRLNVDKQQKNYFDAKPTFLEQESLSFDSSNRFDFERAKQKFDNKQNMKLASSGSKSLNYGFNANSVPSAAQQQNYLRKQGEVSNQKVCNLGGTIETESFLEAERSKNEFGKGNFNLSEFKVSDDETP